MTHTHRKLFQPVAAPYVRALKFALLVDAIVLVLTALMLDGGQMFRESLAGTLAHLALIVLVVIRRPVVPTKMDVACIRFAGIAIFLTILIGVNLLKPM